MRYYLIAGEMSGDQYGANLMRAIIHTDTNAQFAFWGGTEMKNVGGRQDMSIESTSFMGLWEVVTNLSRIKSLIKKAKSDIQEFSPDIVIGIDYPGFNLRIEKWAHKKGYKTAHYISPQIWAWRKYRYKTIKQYVDKLYVILPFEKSIYEELGVDAEYYGHPICERIDKKLIKGWPKEIKTIGLFPGSRLQEIRKNMPVFAEMVVSMPNYKFVVSKVKHIPEEEYFACLPENLKNLSYEDDFHNLVEQSDFAIACSGTVSLELALYRVPQIVVYKTSWINYQLARRLVDIKHISLVNLIAGKRVITELIQEEFNSDKLMAVFKNKCQQENIQSILSSYDSLIKDLDRGESSKQIAGSIVNWLSKAT